MRLMMRNPHFFKEVIEAIEQGQEVSFRVNGWSMLPFYFHDQTVVTVKKEPVNVGDVVLYKDGKITLHRIIEQKGEQFVIQGDGQYRHSSSVGPNAIIGKVIAYQQGDLIIDPNDEKIQRKVKRWLKLKRIPLSRKYLSYLRNKSKHQ